MENYLIKAEDETDYDYGSDPQKRPIKEHISKGIVNLDKTSGPTSHEIDSWVRTILNVQKTGHGGTLDPKVTGVLPIGIDYATRVMHLILSAGKEYICLMRTHKEIPETKLKDIFQEFTGKIYQTPPLKSAVKRELRVRTIYKSEILEIDKQDILFKINCEGGTYIRKYCHDIGEALGCGAHMAELRRTHAGPFQEDETLTTLHRLTDAYYYFKYDNIENELKEMIQPMEKAAEHIPKIVIRDSAVDAICHGANLASGGILKIDNRIQKNEQVAIISLKGELIASGNSYFSAKEILESTTGFMINTQKVFMEPTTYPKLWK